MRFNKPVYFYSDPKNKYNPETGTHDSKPELIKKVWANVTDDDVVRNVEVFGNYDLHIKTVRLVETINFNWSFLMFDDSSDHWVKKTETPNLKIKSFQVEKS